MLGGRESNCRSLTRRCTNFIIDVVFQCSRCLVSDSLVDVGNDVPHVVISLEDKVGTGVHPFELSAPRKLRIALCFERPRVCHFRCLPQLDLLESGGVESRFSLC